MSSGSEDSANAIQSLAETMLAEAVDLVASGWCQGTSARAEDHAPVVPWAATAREWSAMGALAVSWHRRRDPGVLRAADDPVYSGYVAAGGAFTEVVQRAPQSWNDDPRRRADEVVSALRAAQRLIPGRAA